MDEIQIQGYKQIIPGAFVKEGEGKVIGVEDAAGNVTTMYKSRIVTVARYREPTEDDVVVYLKQPAGDATGLFLPESIAKEKSPIEKMFAHPLMAMFKAHILQGHPECEKYIRKHTPAPNPKNQGSHYEAEWLSFHIGYTGVNELQKDLENPELKNNDAQFGYLFEKHDAWQALVGRTLPTASLDVLLEEGVIASIKRFKADGIINAVMYRNEIAETLRALYPAVSTDDSYATLPDITQRKLEEYAIVPVFTRFKELNEQAAVQAEIRAALQKGQLGGKQGQQEDGFTLLSPFGVKKLGSGNN